MLLSAAVEDTTVSLAAIELFNTSPALFVENQGQWADESVRFVHSGSGVNVAMTDAGPVFQLFRPVEIVPLTPINDADPFASLHSDGDLAPQPLETLQFSVSFVGANPAAPTGQEKSESTFNYLLGDESNWRSEVSAYEAVAYESLYDGIDLHTWGLRSSRQPMSQYFR